MKEISPDTRPVDDAHILSDRSPRAEDAFVDFNPEGEKLLTEIRADLEAMKSKEAAMEVLLQELLLSSKATHAALTAHSSTSATSAP